MTVSHTHHEKRNTLLSEINMSLSKDERFAAGWLTGSLARNDADFLSDIDISLVVLKEHSETLCKRLEQASGNTAPERFLLFSQFGKPALIHENNNNAPEGGTFTFTLYSTSALAVDWVLIPQEKAVRPFQSRLLFDKVEIPILPPPEPENVEQSKKAVAEMWAFFWMMTTVTIKYIHRGDGVFANQWIENLHGIIHDIERRMDGKSWSYIRGSFSKLQPTRENQIESIIELTNRMLELKIKVSNFIESEPATPKSEIDYLLSAADK